VDFLKNKGFDASTVDLNANYRPELGARDVTEMTEFIPEFSHRYGAVAAGIGRLGWSGNLLTTDYNALVELGTVITSAKLNSDPLLETNPCDRCKLCTAVCPVEMIGKKNTIKVRVVGIDEEIAEKRPNTCCWIGCTGYHGLAPNGKWSNWSPYRVDYPLPEDKTAIDKLCIRLRKADPEMHLEQNMYASFKEFVFNPDSPYGPTCGNCSLVCSAERKDREENQRLLKNSGVVALTPDGERVSMNPREVTEIDTPCIVRVAIRKEGYPQKTVSKSSSSPTDKRGSTPMDALVLSHLSK
jgi:ferredoxin